MKISEARTTSKSVLTLSDMKGVDLSSSPIRVKSTRASYMKNMICKGGTNHKRNGFEEIASFYGEDGEPLAINGIFPYISEGEEYKIVHAGASLYKCSSDFLTRELISLDGVELGSEKSQGYLSKDELYLIAGDRLLVYDGEKVGALFDSENAYVPTTSIGITDTAHGSLIEPFEGVNLFSTKRINKLTGKKIGEIKKNDADAEQFTIADSEGVFYLDGEIDTTKPVKITAEFLIKNTEDEAALQLYAMTKINESAASGATVCKITTVFDFEPGEMSKQGVSTYVKHGEVFSPDYFEEIYTNAKIYVSARVENRDGRGVVTFTPALPSPVLSEDNITVEYCVKKDEPKIKAICECSVNTYNKMLAIATEDDIVYFSSPSEGYSYFPDNNYIKALDNVSTLFAGGDFLAICSQTESAIVSFSVDSSGERIVCVPSLVSKRADVGCLAPLSSAYVEGDTLFLSDKGIYGASIGGIHMRSSNINKELLSFGKDKLRDAVSIECDGRYYLFVDGIVYIADARYKTYESNRLDVSYEYEWWRWENCPCRVAINHNGKLLLGREDGRIMATHEGYSDITYYELSSCEVNTDGNSFVFYEEIEIGESDRIKIEGAKSSVMALEQIYLLKNTDELQITLDVGDFLALLQRGVIAIDKRLVFYSDEKQFSFTVASYNLEEGKIIGKNYEGELFHQGIMVYEEPYELFSFLKNDEGDYILLNSYGEAVSFIEYDNISVAIVKKVPVECEIHTALFNFAADMKKKTIHKIAFVLGTKTAGKIQVGYETERKNRLMGQVSDALDFSSLDFDNFTFDSTFLRSFDKRVHERNVQFIRLKLLSLEDADFSIESLSVIYSTNSR